MGAEQKLEILVQESKYDLTGITRMQSLSNHGMASMTGIQQLKDINILKRTERIEREMGLHYVLKIPIPAEKYKE